MTVSKTTNVSRTHGTVVLRGGRLTKWKGQAASLSPSLGQLIASVSPVALGRALMVGASKTATAAVLGSAGLIVTTSGASADCTGSGGVYTCSGTMGDDDGDLNTTTTTNLLDVTVSPSTTFNVTSGDAFDLDNKVGITFTNNNPEVTIAGAVDGINALNYGDGALSITTTGTTTGGGDGIRAYNDGTSLTINAATTTGGNYGIHAYNKGDGALSITTTGTTTGTTKYGIFASNGYELLGSVYGTSLTINAATTKGGDHGIKAKNIGSGALSITATGTTTGTNYDGIYANNSSAGTSFTINAATTTGGDDGIEAKNYGSGALSITTSGATTGTSGDGIFAYNSSAGTSLTIKAANTTGATDGIDAKNYGEGALSITTTGDTESGNGSVGIRAYNKSTGTDLTINAATTTGGVHGIYAINNGTGELSITTNTTGGIGVGIYANNKGTGVLSITTTGTTTGTNYDGIYANNSSAGTSLTINAVTTTGGEDGIDAINSGTGALNITTSGAITGGTGYGIRARTAANKTTNITLNSGTVVSSTAGLGIYNNEGNSITTVNSGASVAGKIALGKGIDILVLAGGDLSGVTQFDGGGGILDILKFSGFSGSINSARISNWESVEINKGSTIAFSNKALTINTLGINTGGTLNAVSGTFALTGNMSNSGTVNMADGDTGDKVTVSGNSAGNATGSGQIKIDVDTKANTSDQLAIAGNSSGTTKLAFTNITPGEETGVTITDVVTVAGTSSATDFSGSMLTGIYTYNLQYDAGDFNLVAALNSTSAVYRTLPSALSGFNRMSSLQQRVLREVESNDGKDRTKKRLSFTQAAFTEQQQPNIWIDAGWTRTELETSTGIDLEYTNRNIAAGMDFDIDVDADGRWVVGGYAQYGKQSASVTDVLGTGSIKTSGLGVGATATWYGTTGTYVDVQGQLMWLDSDISSSAGGSLIKDVSSKAYALSVEIGHRIALSETTRLIPQGQLSWGRVDGDSFTDTGSTTVDPGSNDTTTGRLGLAYEYVADEATFYGIGNIVHDFGGDSAVDAGVTSLSADVRETWGEIGLGGSYAVNDNSKLYGEVSYSQAFNNSDINALSASAGIQILW